MEMPEPLQTHGCLTSGRVLPTLVAHGDDDQIVPIVAAAPKTAKLMKGSILKIYPGAPHGMATTRADEFNADLLAFIKD